MQHNQDMLEKRKADWDGKVRIIGLSIDQSKEKMVDHVKAKGWTSVEHYFRNKSDCSEVYGVSGVPHVLLLDTKGRIVFKGHPATRKDLEADFDTLLKGEALTGDGAWVEGAAGASADAKEDEEEEGFKSDLNSEEVEAQVKAFREQAERWCGDEEMTKKATGMPRNFCVMTVEENYVPSTGKMTIRFANHRVIVGSQESTDHFKKLYADEVAGGKGLFEVKEQVHVIPEAKKEEE